jgi:SAM-dependent methyltransferase
MDEYVRRDKYDTIGHAYRSTRRSDPRIADAIHAALSDARFVLNVGAGAGAYEPHAARVVAVEPSSVMIGQRASREGVVRAVAEDLPFADGTFDASMAILTVHHWRDRVRGLTEIRRVTTGRVVILAGDPEVWRTFWLVERYFPSFARLSREHDLAPDAIASALGGGDVRPIPIAADCVDGMTGAFWRRPAAYLDPAIRRGMSSFAAIDERDLERGLRRLEGDLSSGDWRRRYGSVLTLDELDLGYRLVVSDGAGTHRA